MSRFTVGVWCDQRTGDVEFSTLQLNILQVGDNGTTGGMQPICIPPFEPLNRPGQTGTAQPDPEAPQLCTLSAHFLHLATLQDLRSNTGYTS